MAECRTEGTQVVITNTRARLIRTALLFALSVALGAGCGQDSSREGVSMASSTTDAERETSEQDVDSICAGFERMEVLWNSDPASDELREVMDNLHGQLPEEAAAALEAHQRTIEAARRGVEGPSFSEMVEAQQALNAYGRTTCDRDVF